MTQSHNKPHRTMFTLAVDKATSRGELTPQMAICLALAETYLRESPDGRFAELLIGLLQDGQ